MHTFELKIDGDNIEEVLEKIKIIKEKYPDTLINVKMNYRKNLKKRSFKKTPQNKNYK
nr:hypothetical protein [uncultured Tyzzerella sp.]